MQVDLTPDQAAFQQAARAFARQHVAPLAARIDARDEFPVGLVRLAGEHGFMGMTIAAEWGGAGRDYLSAALAYEEIAAASATLAVILVVNNALVVEPLFRFGTDEQKARWLRPLARGELVGAFALSEEDAGTDAANQQTLAEALPGGGFRLNGRKTWVTCASAADLVIAFGSETTATGKRPVSAFLLPMNTPGLVRGARAESMGVRGLGGLDLELRDVDVADGALLGTRGAGFELARWAFEGARIGIAAQAIGIGQVAFEEARAHAKRRHTFGKPIASYEAIQFMLADCATELDAARVLTWKAAATKDQHGHCAVEAAMAKLYASEAASKVTDRAMQILASAGYRRGSTLERLYRDVRAAEMYPGTSEVQRMLISGAVLRG
jgi:butyryl-CoA dehydrogenase